MSDATTPKKKPYEKPTLSEGALRPAEAVLSNCDAFEIRDAFGEVDWDLFRTLEVRQVTVDVTSSGLFDDEAKSDGSRGDASVRRK